MAGSPQWHAEQPYVQKCFSRAGMDNLLLITSIQEMSEAAGHFNTLCVYFKVYHFKNEHQANFPPLPFSCFLAFWAECCGAEGSHPRNAHRAVGGTLHPRLLPPTWDQPRHLLPAPLAPCSSHIHLLCHEGPHIFLFWLVAAVQRAWSSMSPLNEQYLCSSFIRYKCALIMFKKRTLVSFPVHCRRYMVGISVKRGNHVKLFDILGSVQKALKTDDLNPWKYLTYPH